MQPVIPHRHPVADVDGDLRLRVPETHRFEDTARQELTIRRPGGRLERVAEHAVADVGVVEVLAGREPGLGVAECPDVEARVGGRVHAADQPGRVREQMLDPNRVVRRRTSNHGR